MKFKRASGVLMHISSLVSNSGIGTLGKEAYEFVDFLKQSGQSYWQILPICPTSFGDSPYQSFSTFAGNPYFIDLDILAKEGYLAPEDYKNIVWESNETTVDYPLIFKNRNKVFLKLQQNFKNNIPKDFFDFCAKNSYWLEDYALFMAVKDEFLGKEYTLWDEDIKKREQTALNKWRKKCKERIEYYKILQYFFFKQWFALKEYANKNGIKIIGDLPIYVAADSADVWSNLKNFVLNKDLTPKVVAGCPPDSFSKEGQLWGNPVYNWRYMKFDRYSWWLKRLEASLKIYDVVRIDHFRGFEGYYTIKYGSKNACNGRWKKGPSIAFWRFVKQKLGDVPIIAEDLGFLTNGVRKMLKRSGFPGMKVLQFAFSGDMENEYLPHNYKNNCVVYTGTHDNDTLLGWVETLNEKEVEFTKKYLQCSKEEIAEKVMVAAMSSVADLCILTMQDLIGLDGESRMNTPSTVGENWKWRMTKEQKRQELATKLLNYTNIYGRKGKNE